MEEEGEIHSASENLSTTRSDLWMEEGTPESRAWEAAEAGDTLSWQPARKRGPSSNTHKELSSANPRMSQGTDPPPEPLERDATPPFLY